MGRFRGQRRKIPVAGRILTARRECNIMVIRNGNTNLHQLSLDGFPQQAVPLALRSPRARFEQRLGERVRVVQDPPRQTFYIDHRPFLSVRLDRPEEQRLAAVLLLESGALTQAAVAAFFGVTDRSIRNWQRAYQERGVEGLTRGHITEEAPGVAPAPKSPMSAEPPQAVEPVVRPPAPAEPKEVITRYAGLSLLAPFARPLLEPLWQYVVTHRGDFADTTFQWNASTLLPLLVLYTAWRIENPEQSKTIHRREFGVLLDQEASPCCRTLRRRLPVLVRGSLPDEAPRLLAKTLLEQGWIRLGEFHLDGHFVPYHGQHALAKGWWPQRQSPQKGYYQHWVNDRRGKPLFCLFHQAFASFSHVIPEMARQIQDLLHEAGVAQEQPFIVAFDRGGYSADLFRTLDEMGVGWVTYKKHAPDVSPDVLTERVGLFLDGRDEFPVVEYGVMRTTVTDYRDDVYAVAFAGRGKKPVILISNVDRIAPERCSPVSLIHLLHDRWAQENFFKVAKVREGIDHLMGQEIQPLEDDGESVPNPEYSRLRKRQRQIQKHCEKAQHRCEQIAKRYETLKSKPSWSRYLEQQDNQKRLKRRDALQRELDHCTQHIAHTPEHVPYKSLHPEDRDVVNFDRHKVVLTLKCIAYHAREALLKAAERYFLDHRERSKFVDVLLQAGGRYVRGTRTDTVYLHAPETPIYREAARDLMEHLNAMQPKTLTESPRRLQYRIE